MAATNKVVVTGATGFLGSHIARRLAAGGAQVTGAVRTPSRGAWLGAEGIDMARADLSDVDSLTEAFAGADTVVANAALSTRGRASWEEFLAANQMGAKNQVLAAARAGVKRIVYISTVAVYRPGICKVNRDTAMLLDGPPLAVSFAVTNWRYALSKAHGERLVWALSKEHGLQTTVLRPGPIYGSRDVKLTAKYAASMKRSVAFAPTVRVPHVHAGDVAQAVDGAIQNPQSTGRAYNVTASSVSPYDVLTTWRNITGQGPRIVPVPLPLWIDFDDSAAQQDLGFRPRNLKQGIEEVLAA